MNKDKKVIIDVKSITIKEKTKEAYDHRVKEFKDALPVNVLNVSEHPVYFGVIVALISQDCATL